MSPLLVGRHVLAMSASVLALASASAILVNNLLTTPLQQSPWHFGHRSLGIISRVHHILVTLTSFQGHDLHAWLIFLVNAVSLEPLVRFQCNFIWGFLSAWPRIEKVLVMVDWFLFKRWPFWISGHMIFLLRRIPFSILVRLPSNLLWAFKKMFLNTD